jgi:hypothetical protein
VDATSRSNTLSNTYAKPRRPLKRRYERCRQRYPPAICYVWWLL